MMATAKANRKGASGAVDLPECPVCFETMTAPIYQCSSGHSLCNRCTNSLCPPLCPICRQAMTQMRNWQLEDIIMKAKVPCPNRSDGCVYTMMYADVANHINECIFREMPCPLGVVFGKCSWSGRLKEMMDHFKERHPNNCNVSSDSDIELNNIGVKTDERLLYLVAQGKIHFIITMKIDTLQKMAYWTIQLIGGKGTAQQHIYEIHVNSKKDERRQVVFIEHCFSDAMKADEVFREGKCAMLPLDSLKHFINNGKLSFRFFIKRIPPTSGKDAKPKGNSNNENSSEKSGPNQKHSGPSHAPGQNKGPHGAGGPKGPWPKGPGPKGHGPKGVTNAKKHNKHAE